MINFLRKMFMGDAPNTGAIQDRPDQRDYKWKEFAPAYTPLNWSDGYDVETELKKAINDHTFTLPVKDQGTSSSCGGQAWANYGGVIEALATGTFEERSAKFIYSQTYIKIPGGGSTGRDNSNFVKKQGWGLEKLTTSYNGGLPPGEPFMERSQDVTDIARHKASQATAISYADAGIDIDSIAHAITINGGAIIGINGINNGSWKSNHPIAPTRSQMNSGFAWRHWSYVGKVGMLNGKKAIKIFNSWGRSTGDAGWQWIDEDYFKAMGVWGSWTIMYDNKPQPIEEGFRHQFLEDMSINKEGAEVLALQTALQTLGFFPQTMKPTGYYGSVTASAVYKFQVAQGITYPDRNNAGPKTRTELNKIFAS